MRAGTVPIIAIGALIGLHHGRQHQRDAPPVQEDMMEAPAEHKFALAECKQRQPQQRRRVERKPARCIPAEPIVDPLALHRCRKPRQIEACPGRLDLAQHGLKRLRGIAPQKGGTQHGMTVHHISPGQREPIGVERTCE